mmetsp:Transcript_12748/g.17127  ORF Transcript_12748/g.17127 Transcript_12748/m.17127 type:complete len:315 (+) Transcript_12748:2075-3019(+)|eukprot:CAMPEP_0197330342 /NCGR_PEP_ID=MMETSP0892-20130614/6698_1 /TAXON_ID=44058 ORGANISM="Aureoumbra lagunensis, Strain CCMP1510" /NCGR_SAMPLE_ID=MMETSP0892 /ASSEMBLY_ACC=CAM_ASM_000538 /LENGTH=314 /DNA_ID=CAMNT_0042827479 /DNA_START=451 /DNA_END=1398 /DNA_ORIENTATION=-
MIREKLSIIFAIAASSVLLTTGLIIYHAKTKRRRKRSTVFEIQPTARVLTIIGDRVYVTRTSKVFPKWLYGLGNKANDAVLIPLQVKAEDLAAVLLSLKKCENFDGAVITKPFKEVSLKLCDELTASASAIGAVNCIRCLGGVLVGANFDGLGFCDGLGMNVQNKRCLILGAGGAARAITYTLSTRQAQVTIFNRSYARALELKHIGAAHVIESLISFCDLSQHFDILINATSLGHSADDPLPIPDITMLKPPLLVADVIMDPPETRLLTQAKLRGCNIHHGRHMLDAQSQLIATFLATEPIYWVEDPISSVRQ